MEIPQKPVPEATSTNSQGTFTVKHRMREAWSPEILKTLGESQGERLAKWVAKDRQEKGDDYLTVPVLQGMLEMLITYYPEESSRVLPN